MYRHTLTWKKKLWYYFKNRSFIMLTKEILFEPKKNFPCRDESLFSLQSPLLLLEAAVLQPFGESEMIISVPQHERVYFWRNRRCFSSNWAAIDGTESSLPPNFISSLIDWFIWKVLKKKFSFCFYDNKESYKRN